MGTTLASALHDTNRNDPIQPCHESASRFTWRQYRISPAVPETTDGRNGLLVFGGSPSPPTLALTGAALADRSR